MVPDSTHVEKLAPPGAGIPWRERLIGRVAAAVLPRIWSWESVPDRLDAQADALLAMMPPADDARFLQPVFIARVAGLEDSSRYWSPAMILEHLVIISSRMIPIIVALSRERVPPDETRIADLKPTGIWTGRRAIDEYRQSLADFRRTVLHEVGNRNARARYPHPWFGPLNVRQWVCFAPFHQDIHVRQMKRMRQKMKNAE